MHLSGRTSCRSDRQSPRHGQGLRRRLRVHWSQEYDTAILLLQPTRRTLAALGSTFQPAGACYDMFPARGKQMY
jgi:hypothetical protein